MRYLALPGVVLALLSGPVAATAEQPRYPTITPRQEGASPVRLGFPTGGASQHQFKTGFWTPVYVDLAYQDKNDKLRPIGPTEGDLVVESSDSDEMQTRYVAPWPALRSGDRETVLLYTQPGKASSDITVSVRDAAGRVLQTHKVSRESVRELAPATQLYLLAGMPVPDPLKKATLALAQGRAGPRAMDATSALCSVDSVEQLPDRWFGYAAVDALILTTGNRAFVEGLIGNNTKREALEEWVRRGGRVVLSAGENQQFVRDLLAKMPLLKCTLIGGELRDLPEVSAKWTQEAAELRRVPVAVLEPILSGQNIDVLAPTEEKAGKARPLIVQAPCGTGRAVLVAFDLDREPFTDWPGQEKFWHKLLRELEPRAIRGDGNPNLPLRGGVRSENTEIASHLVDSLEDFGDRVPVIYFGWVALFILLYIIVVGPLDYLFLKKVVKRLEWTWVTFPLIVLVVSLVAYFTATRLKGSDLLVNKIDVIDIVCETPPDGNEATGAEAFGTTWFTLFSPRIQHYTIGLEPAFPRWAAERNNPAAYAVVLSALGKPESLYGGTGRSGSLGLFRKAYQYAPQAAGLEGVTIQVWAAKSFTGSWRAPLRGPQAVPLFRSDLKQDPKLQDKNILPLTGHITNELGVELKNAVLFYEGSWFALGRFEAGSAKDVAPHLLPNLGESRLKDRWFEDYWWEAGLPGDDGRHSATLRAPAARRFFKPLLFHRDDSTSAMTGLRNSTLRHLDQSWRLGKPHRAGRPERQEEAVLVGRLGPLEGSAEKVNNDGVSPSRLWLGRLPGDKHGWDPPDGKFTQETYVRVYLPVAVSREP